MSRTKNSRVEFNEVLSPFEGARSKIKIPELLREAKFEEVLEKLKCSVCSGYLSCGPVFQTEDDKAICGRCPKPKMAAIRVSSYEHVAEMLDFPCPNETYGCKQLIPFSQQKSHEAKCEFRPLFCVIEASSCRWTGARCKMREHCEATHPSNVLRNPGFLKVNWTKHAHRTFLMSAFTTMFLVHTKICLTSKKLLFSVCQLGEPESGSLYSFQLDLKRNREKISKVGTVVPASEEPILENSATQIQINTLVDIFGNLDGIMFKISIHTKCAKCLVASKKVIFHEDKGWFCTDCFSLKRSCKYRSKGCLFTDYDKKCVKHEYHFCQYSTWCCICLKDIAFLSLEGHRALVHANITYSASTVWRGIVNNNWQHCIVESNIGNLLCSHWVNSSVFQLRVGSPLLSKQLHAYKCIMILCNPASENFVRKIAHVVYDNTHDWLIEIEKDEFLSFVNNEEFDVKIDVIKIETDEL